MVYIDDDNDRLYKELVRYIAVHGDDERQANHSSRNQWKKGEGNNLDREENTCRDDFECE